MRQANVRDDPGRALEIDSCKEEVCGPHTPVEGKGGDGLSQLRAARARDTGAQQPPRSRQIRARTSYSGGQQRTGTPHSADAPRDLPGHGRGQPKQRGKGGQRQPRGRPTSGGQRAHGRPPKHRLDGRDGEEGKLCTSKGSRVSGHL